jgi:hypothetical protein
MKSLIKYILIPSAVILFVLFFWNEWQGLSTSKKINADKISAFFTAIGSIATAVTVYLIYKQIEEQRKDRKAAAKPDLYPEDQFFSVIMSHGMSILKRDKKDDRIIGLINLHNIGFGAAKEIKVIWHFNKDVISPLVDQQLLKVYLNSETESKHSFVLPISLIEIPLPLMYLSSFRYFKEGWLEMTWEELFLEIIYKDVHNNRYTDKKFKAFVYVSSNYVLIKFIPSDNIKLSKESTMIATELAEQKRP